MTEKDKERIIIYRRILGNSKDKNSLYLMNLSDEDLLNVLNKTVYPNSLSISALKYSLLTNMIFNKKLLINEFKKLDKTTEVLTQLEKDMFKFGLFYGYNTLDIEYQYSRFVRHSVKPDIGVSIFKKKIPINVFRQTFEFIYKLLIKGDKNERFPRV